jgi:hypothetical protein
MTVHCKKIVNPKKLQTRLSATSGRLPNLAENITAVKENKRCLALNETGRDKTATGQKNHQTQLGE